MGNGPGNGLGIGLGHGSRAGQRAGWGSPVPVAGADDDAVDAKEGCGAEDGPEILRVDDLVEREPQRRGGACRPLKGVVLLGRIARRVPTPVRRRCRGLMRVGELRGRKGPGMRPGSQERARDGNRPNEREVVEGVSSAMLLCPRPSLSPPLLHAPLPLSPQPWLLSHGPPLALPSAMLPLS